MKKVFFFTSVLFALLACSKDKSVSDANSRDDASTAYATGNKSFPSQNIVHILNSGYSPDSLMVNINSSVAWVNDDNATHTVSSDKFDSGDIPPGGTFQFAFDNTGTYRYFCKYHSEKGVIVVAGIR